MSMRGTKEQLLALLDKPDIRVIALSGKWGTGKSHLWDEIRKERGLDSRYASLFGLSDIQQLKLKLVQHDYKTFGEFGGKALQVGVKWLEERQRGAGAVATSVMDLLTLGLPRLLRGKLLVIDDLERRNKNLDLDALLGFIDEFTKQHDCRFLLILNEENLKKEGSENKEWESYKEKVIDQEVKLRTTPKEACEIAFRVRKNECPHQGEIEEAIDICGISNIRIILKIIQSVDRIIGHVEGLSRDVVKRMIPSVVVLAGTYFKGIENGPDAQYIIKAGSAATWATRTGRAGQDIDEAEFNKREKWNGFLAQLGILMADEFEVQAWKAISTGFVEPEKIDAIVQTYLKDEKKIKVDQTLSRLHDELAWNDKVTDEEIKALLSDLTKAVEYIDPYTVTATLKWIEGLFPVLKGMSMDLLYQWIAVRRMGKLPVHIEVPDTFGRDCHEAILSYRDEWLERHKAVKPLHEAWLHVAKLQGYGEEEEMVIDGATVEDYMKAIKELGPDDRKTFVRVCLHYSSEGSTVFSRSIARFKEAVNELVGDGKTPERLRMILLYTCASVIKTKDDMKEGESHGHD